MSKGQGGNNNNGMPSPPSFQIAEGTSDEAAIMSLDDIFGSSGTMGMMGDVDVSLKRGSMDKDNDGGGLEYDSDDFDDLDDNDGDRKRSRGLQRNMTEEQKVERRYVILYTLTSTFRSMLMFCCGLVWSGLRNVHTFKFDSIIIAGVAFT